jgi:hypothetical protein
MSKQPKMNLPLYSLPSIKCIGLCTCMSEAGRIDSHLERTIQDTDIGGLGNHYVILLENLDKGLSPLSVAEFIHRETSISPQVYVFPNLTSAPSTQGALVLDCEMKFLKLSDFLDNSNHIIMSSRERYACICIILGFLASY